MSTTTRPTSDPQGATVTENRPGAGPRDPEELEAADAGSAAEIPAGTRMGAVHLTVADLERSVGFYRQSIGLEVLERDVHAATLGTTSEPLLVLVEEPGARPAAGFTGLYHFALLVPERRDLACWLAHAARERVPLTGAADHFVSEALYLDDPDGHGIEIYWDRPREQWEGQVAARMTTMRLDLDGLLGELDDPRTAPFSGLAAGTTMGHVHLKVADIGATVAFYRDTLGFGLMAALGPQAAFLSAGGYHHHVGANVWESAGAPAPPPGTAALRRATIVLPDEHARRTLIDRLAGAGHELAHDDGVVVRDPSGNALALVATP
jgi:catechol 2,3-dioxygenase